MDDESQIGCLRGVVWAVAIEAVVIAIALAILAA